MKMKLLLITAIFSSSAVSPQIRNPFAFTKTHETVNKVVTNEPTSLSKWNIKEQGEDLIVIENSDDGQIRTIEIASFTH